jgi:hypothetical protein
MQWNFNKYIIMTRMSGKGHLDHRYDNNHELRTRHEELVLNL